MRREPSHSTRRWILPAAVPVAALVLIAFFTLKSLSGRGSEITIQFMATHGLEPGDEVRFQGAVIGRVASIEASSDLLSVTVVARLYDDAQGLAVTGSRFWVVRPELRARGVSGLDTLVGPNYIAALPGPSGGAERRSFVGLDAAPVVERIEPGDLEVILATSQAGALTPGAPLLYRDIPIGAVLSLGLTADAGAVEMRVLVRQAYRALVCENSRFFAQRGLKGSVNLSGISLEVDSLRALLEGAIEIATPSPDKAGAAVHTGHRFVVASRRDDEWALWQPRVPIGNELLPEGTPLIRPRRAVLSWKEGSVIARRHANSGWVIPLGEEIVGPIDMLWPMSIDDEAPDDDVVAGSVALEVEGMRVAIVEPARRCGGRLAARAIALPAARWDPARVRLPEAGLTPEDCVAIGDPAQRPVVLAAGLLTAAGSKWAVNPALALDDSWHGAAVIARGDGFLVGVLVRADDEWFVEFIQTKP